MSKEAKELERAIKELVPVLERKDRRLKVSLLVFEDWLYKNGEVSRKDVDNRTKFLIDAVFKALEVDDKYIFEQHVYKMQSDKEEFTLIEIEHIC